MQGVPPRENLTPEAIAALQRRIDRGGELFICTPRLFVSDARPLVDEAVVLYFSLEGDRQFASGQLSLNGQVVAAQAAFGEYVFSPVDETPCTFQFDVFDEEGNPGDSTTLTISPRIIRPQVELEIASGRRKVPRPEPVVLNYRVSGARQAQLQVGAEIFDLQEGSGAIELPLLSNGTYEASLVANGPHAATHREGSASTTLVFERTDPLPSFEEVSLLPERPHLGDTMLLTVACRHVTQLTLVDHNGHSQSFVEEVQNGGVLVHTVSAGHIGPYHFKLIAKGSGGTKVRTFDGEITPPAIQFDLHMPRTAYVGGEATMIWDVRGATSVRAYHGIDWLNQFGDENGLPPQGQLRFPLLAPGQHEFTFLLERPTGGFEEHRQRIDIRLPPLVEDL